MRFLCQSVATCIIVLLHKVNAGIHGPGPSELPDSTKLGRKMQGAFVKTARIKNNKAVRDGSDIRDRLRRKAESNEQKSGSSS